MTCEELYKSLDQQRIAICEAMALIQRTMRVSVGSAVKARPRRYARRLDPNRRKMLVSEVQAGEKSPTDLAHEYGVSPQRIYNIRAQARAAK